VVKDLVHHSQVAVSVTRFQGWPSEVLDHSGDTAVIVSVACDIPGRVMLDLFKLIGVPAGVRIPDSGSVLDSQPNVGFVGYVASTFGAGPQVPRKKSTATVSSFTDRVNMIVEGQFRVDVYTEKFSRVYFLSFSSVWPLIM